MAANSMLQKKQVTAPLNAASPAPMVGFGVNAAARQSAILASFKRRCRRD